MLHDVSRGSEEALENTAFALKCIEEIVERRKNESAKVICDEARNEIALLSAAEGNRFRKILHLVSRLSSVVADLRSAIGFELHEILIPFHEVKGPTHEFGKRMFLDYFRWLPEDREYSPEQVVGILEWDLDRLNVAFEHLEKAKHPRTRRRGN